MSISSISNSGHFISRPIKKRASLERVHEETIQRGKKKSNQEQQTDFESHLRNNQTDTKNTSKKEPSKSKTTIVDFISQLERLPPTSDRVSNTYQQIGNFEKQQEVKRMFGVDMYV